MKLLIDNKTVKLSRPVTVLEAADKNGIYIPRMCAHPELEPYGGCRLCIVEIEGVRGYPTACTTMVRDGMVVRTDTNMVRQMRLDLLQLILSEHPAACLLCEHCDGCSMFQETIRKVGVTTGCRWCPKDRDCELQRIVESFEIHEISLPGIYRDEAVEKYDPFFDRDYNLCIYCGRCVRICNEYRKNSVISLRQRGKHTTIGPSFSDSHTDAGCEYCGACVSVCPTGAMSDKSRKWWGVPDTYTKSVCPLCSINCEIQVLSLKDRIVGTFPPGKPHEDAGRLCVKGRFCLSEIVNRTERLLEPRHLYPEGEAIIGWKEALSKGGELLKGLGKDRTAVFVAPDLSNEEYGAVAEFSKKVLKTDNITSSCCGNRTLAYMKLGLNSIPLKKVAASDAIVSLFLNGNYNFAPLTMALKNAASIGTPYYQLGWIKDTTTKFAQEFILPLPGDETKLLDGIIGCLDGKPSGRPEVQRLADDLKNGNSPLLIIGPWVLSLSNFSQVLERLYKVIDLTGAGVYVPVPHGNSRGMLSILQMKPAEDIVRKIDNGEVDLVYLLGDIPFRSRSGNYRLIFQGAFPVPEDLHPDLVLPSCVWGESSGTWNGMDGKRTKARKAGRPHGYALTNIDIINRISASAGAKDIKDSIKKRNSSIPAKLTPEIPDFDLAPSHGKDSASQGLPFVLVIEDSPHTYMNLSLGEAIEGLSELVDPGKLAISHHDARKLELATGDVLTVSDKTNDVTMPVRIRKNIPDGVVYLAGTKGHYGFKTNPCYVNIKKANVQDH